MALRKLKFGLIAVLAMVLLFGVVAGVAAQEPAGDFAVVQAAADAYLSSGAPPTISADALWENMNDGDPENDPLIVSVRSPEHYALGHVPGAINIPWKQIAKSENLAKLPTDRQIVVYCYTGHTGQLATTVLNLLGYDAVNLKFGMMGWTEDDEVLVTTRFGPDTDQRDYRLETEAHEPMQTYPFPELDVEGEDDFEIVRAAADRWITEAEAPIVSADSVFENLNDGDPENNPVIVSVRSPDPYALGHVPTAINIPWRDLAKPESLAQLPPDQRIVTYCYTGHTGQVAATILGVLGYDVGNMKYGMMAWTEDDEVLATTRFSPDVQRDYRLEQGEPEMAAAEAETQMAEEAEMAPEQMPETGAPVTMTWLLWLLAGAGSLAGGAALRRR